MYLLSLCRLLLNSTNILQKKCVCYNEICVHFCTCFVISHNFVFFVRQSNRNGYMFSFLLFHLLWYSIHCRTVLFPWTIFKYVALLCALYFSFTVSDHRFSLSTLSLYLHNIICFIFLARTKIYCTYVMEVSWGILSHETSLFSFSLPFFPLFTVHLNCVHFFSSLVLVLVVIVVVILCSFLLTCFLLIYFQLHFIMH